MNSHPQRLGALTAFRFVAAAMIVLIHTGGYFRLPPLSDVMQLTQGVSFFFVLSGFILAYNYDTDRRRRSWTDFYVARFARVWPAHVAVLVIYIALALPTEAVGNPFAAVGILLANATLTHAWLPFQGSFWSYNAVSWTLSTEFGFYLLFPWLVRRRAGTLPWTALGVGFALAVGFVALGAALGLTLRAESFEPSLLGVILVNPLARLFEFTMGIFACALYRRASGASAWGGTPMELAALLLVASCVHAFTENRVQAWPASPGYYLVWAGAGPAFALLVFVFAIGRGVVARALAARPFILLGEISFCLYLVHQPILTWIALHRALPVDGWLGVTVYWLSCLAVAGAGFVLVERPARAWIVGRWRPGLAGATPEVDVAP